MPAHLLPEGMLTSGNIFHNLTVPELVELSVRRGEGVIADNGALVVRTGERTGRSPSDRYIVDTNDVTKEIWWGKFNIPVPVERFDHLYRRIAEFLSNKDIFVVDAFAGTDPAYRLPVRVITKYAWHSLFAKTLFVRPTPEEAKNFQPVFTVINTGDQLQLDPEKDGFGSSAAVVINFQKKMILIAGTGYGGETKKSIFSVMNYLLPKKGVFPMHCSANVGPAGDSAIFFGLSGTGKTTLSADSARRLIGDDEHGWSENGLFNFEGGCYAKCINLSKEAEPQIYSAIRSGSILENVPMDAQSRRVDYNDGSITENTRATYPVEFIPNCIHSGTGPHPKNIFFLACDAFGVLPPISKLTSEMAMYHFISGYTARVAGTEVGLTEPAVTFSACFGEPFLPLHPMVYAELLKTKMNEHKVNCWLINTGWNGGSSGEGKRMPIQTTRALLAAALNGDLDKAEFKSHNIFKVPIPTTCPGVSPELLDPKASWRNKEKYEETARKISQLFRKNIEKYAGGISPEVLSAGPIF